ncbi:MAG: S41 family peptidase [Bacilli bacterium]|nr:S41 family peptidase [Bacilli bacterium]
MTQKYKKTKKSSFGIFEVSILITMTCLLSLAFGYYLGHKTTKNQKNDIYIEKFKTNYQYILDNYYKEVDKSTLIDSAVRGMVESLDDDFSTYLDQSTSNTFDATLEGSYEGLGISIVGDTEGNITIARVFENSPASKAGLKEGDILLSINDTKTTNMATTDITDMIKKDKKGTFKIDFRRNNEEMTAEIKKENITIQSVSSKMIEQNNKKIGYISINIFALNTGDQFKAALKDLEKQKMDSLIIDVRDNGGGHLLSTAEVISSLLDKSKVIYQTELKETKTKVYSTGKVTKKYPIVILSNQGTASGSEVLIGALTENTNAITVGTTTYGKGTVQELVSLGTGNEYKVTVKKWLTPKGTWVNEKGIKPTIEVEATDAYKENQTEENDTQLKAAIDYIQNK